MDTKDDDFGFTIIEVPNAKEQQADSNVDRTRDAIRQDVQGLYLASKVSDEQLLTTAREIIKRLEGVPHPSTRKPSGDDVTSIDHTWTPFGGPDWQPFSGPDWQSRCLDVLLFLLALLLFIVTLGLWMKFIAEGFSSLSEYLAYLWTMVIWSYLSDTTIGSWNSDVPIHAAGMVAIPISCMTEVSTLRINITETFYAECHVTGLIGQMALEAIRIRNATNSTATTPTLI